jgi:hypothetical protein
MSNVLVIKDVSGDSLSVINYTHYINEAILCQEMMKQRTSMAKCLWGGC